MSERVLGKIQVWRWNWWKDETFHEVLILKPDSVFVSLIRKDILPLDYQNVIGDVIRWFIRRRKKEESNFTIFNSDIIRVELSKFLKAYNLSITTRKRKFKWRITQDSIEYCKNILQLAFPGKFAIMK